MPQQNQRKELLFILTAVITGAVFVIGAGIYIVLRTTEKPITSTASDTTPILDASEAPVETSLPPTNNPTQPNKNIPNPPTKPKTNLNNKNLTALSGKVSKDLGRIFRYFIDAGKKIYVNEKQILSIEHTAIFNSLCYV